jgi:hypothetical protein
MASLYYFRTLEEIEQFVDMAAPLLPYEAKVRMGLRELMINAVEHGNLEIHYEEKTRLLQQGKWRQKIDRRLSLPHYEHRRAVISFSRQKHQLFAEITDAGQGFQWQPYLETSAERLLHPHGRGIALAHQYCFAGVSFSPEGNTVKAMIPLG